MLLAVDIGNTRIKFGLYEGSSENTVCSFAISSHTVRTSCEYELLIKQLLLNSNINEIPDRSVVSSVVPSLSQPICDALTAICKRQPFIIGTGTRTGFKINIDIQSQLGADIVSNTAAAFEFVKPPFVIVDTGTATTITAVDTNGELIGTVIAPGAQLSLEALNNSAALLFDTSLIRPSSVIGKNSQSSIQSGCYWGHVYMIDGFIRNLRDQLCPDGEKLGLVCTGGLSNLILNDCRNKFVFVPDLTLKGAASLYFHNAGIHKKAL